MNGWRIIRKHELTYLRGVARGASKMPLWIGFSCSTPLWNGRYRLHLVNRGIRWAWTATEQATGRVVAEGRTWTLGGAVWAAERATGA